MRWTSRRPALSSARWRRLVPIAFVTYSFAYLDRSNYSIGAAGGLTDHLHITAGQTGLLGGLFFIGHFLFQVPAGDLAERRSVKVLLFWSLIGWGILAALQGVVTTFALLLAVRFLLGVVEAVVLPAMVVFLSHWFTRRERGRANSLLILGNPVTLLWMSVASGYLVAAVGYRWMFISEGLPAIAWAFAFRWRVADRPRDAAWLAEDERQDVEAALAAEQPSLPAPGGLWQTARSWNAVLLSAQYLLWSVGVYGLVFWLPTILKDLTGRGIGSTGALPAAGAAHLGRRRPAGRGRRVVRARPGAHRRGQQRRGARRALGGVRRPRHPRLHPRPARAGARPCRPPLGPLRDARSRRPDRPRPGYRGDRLPHRRAGRGPGHARGRPQHHRHRAARPAPGRRRPRRPPRCARPVGGRPGDHPPPHAGHRRPGRRQDAALAAARRRRRQRRPGPGAPRGVADRPPGERAPPRGGARRHRRGAAAARQPARCGSCRT